MNRVGLESRALQLARVGLKNLLCLTGDYNGRGFQGQSAPVFDLDSVLLTRMIKGLTRRLQALGDMEPFFQGCGVSPFKTLQSECLAQYKKLDKKIAAGADFVVTQLGYDINKFNELIRYHKEKNDQVPVMASVYLLNPGIARTMNQGRVPGTYVSDSLLDQVESEWKDKKKGMKTAIERVTRLGAVLRGFGYNGIQIGGIHKNYDTVGTILDRMEELQGNWRKYVSDFAQRDKAGYYWYNPIQEKKNKTSPDIKERITEHVPYRMLDAAHSIFFDKENSLAPLCRSFARLLDKTGKAWILKRCLEDPIKINILSCRGCGDCGLAQTAFICPQSHFPKHTRNGPCGGSRSGCCEVSPEKKCIWVRVHSRLKYARKLSNLLAEQVPSRNWELNNTSSWVNFHLNRGTHSQSPSKPTESALNNFIKG